jgi:hypothetical protein
MSFVRITGVSRGSYSNFSVFLLNCLGLKPRVGHGTKFKFGGGGEIALSQSVKHSVKHINIDWNSVGLRHSHTDIDEDYIIYL